MIDEKEVQTMNEQEVFIDAPKEVKTKRSKIGRFFAKIGKGIWFVITSIGYILGVVFAFHFICDLLEGKKKK